MPSQNTFQHTLLWGYANSLPPSLASVNTWQDHRFIYFLKDYVATKNTLEFFHRPYPGKKCLSVCLFCFWLLVNYTSHKKSNSKARAARLQSECWIETVSQSWGWKNTDQQVPTTFQRTCAMHRRDTWTIKDNLFWK